MKKMVELIGASSGWGCQQHGCEFGPAILQDTGLQKILTEAGAETLWQAMLTPTASSRVFSVEGKMAALPLVVDICERLAQQTKHTVEQGRLPVVLGGDHSLAIGTWSGIIPTLDAQEKFGMIWLDAHMDAHTLETSDQGKWGGWWHGMPVAALTGHGETVFTELEAAGAKLSPAHITLMGIRSFEAGEQAFVEEHGIRVMYQTEIEERGFAACMEEAYARATQGTKGYGISIDLDGFDPEDAPGVTSMEKNGLHAEDVVDAFKNIAGDPLLQGVEIMEYNPSNDKDYQTARLVHRLLKALLAKEA